MSQTILKGRDSKKFVEKLLPRGTNILLFQLIEYLEKEPIFFNQIH